MKVKVIKEFETEIFVISQLEEQSIPKTYTAPYFIVIESREVLRKSGKTRYFDSLLINAQEYESFSHALAVANKFKKNDFSPGQQFYLAGMEQAKIIQMENEEQAKKFMNAFKTKV